MPILLTGGTGLLGTELLQHRPDLVAPTRGELNVSDGEVVNDWLTSNRPEIVIHAAAATDNRQIESDPSDAILTNIIGTANVARACISTGSRLVYISTDYVYKGDKGNYSEDDEVRPVNLYAWTKLGGETAVAAVPNHLIIRTSFGRSKFDYPAAFADKWSSKEYVDIIAPSILELALSTLIGVINLGGPRRTLYEYAVQRNPDVAKLSLGESEHDSPADTSMDLDKWLAWKGESS